MISIASSDITRIADRSDNGTLFNRLSLFNFNAPKMCIARRHMPIMRNQNHIAVSDSTRRYFNHASFGDRFNGSIARSRHIDTLMKTAQTADHFSMTEPRADSEIAPANRPGKVNRHFQTCKFFNLLARQYPQSFLHGFKAPYCSTLDVIRASFFSFGRFKLFASGKSPHGTMRIFFQFIERMLQDKRQLKNVAFRFNRRAFARYATFKRCKINPRRIPGKTVPGTHTHTKQQADNKRSTHAARPHIPKTG